MAGASAQCGSAGDADDDDAPLAQLVRAPQQVHEGEDEDEDVALSICTCKFASPALAKDAASVDTSEEYVRMRSPPHPTPPHPTPPQN